MCTHSSIPTQVFIEMDESSCDLFDIVQNNHLDQLKQFSGNRLLLQRNREGMSLLHAAVISNNLEALQFLLDENIIPINTQDKNKETSLHLSVKSGSTGTMTMLLKKGADNMIKNSDNNTPLHLLLQSDSESVEQLSEFLKHPVDISVNGANGSSIFHAIVENDNIEALRLIARLQVLDTAKYFYNNTFCLQNDFGMSAIHYASLRGAHKVLDFMLSKARESSDSHLKKVLCHLDKRLNTPLHIAVEHGHKGTVDILLKYKASPTAIEGNKLPPIHLACVQNKMDIAMAMVESFGVEVLLGLDSTGATPLHCCSKSVSEELFCFVVNNGSNLNAQDNNGNTPLHVSVVHGNAGRVEFLLAKGSDPTIQNKSGFNPFHLSILSRRREEFKALAKSQHAKRLSLLPDSQGYWPVHLALKHKFSQSIPTLVSLAMDSDSNFDDLNILAYKDKDGNSFLHTSAESMDVSSLKYLLSLRCSRYLLNCLNSEGLLPLHLAARSGFVASVRELVDHGAVEQISYNGDTPFMLACRHGHLETAKLLIEVSLINKNEVNNGGNSALHLAARSKNVDVILMCLDLGIEITLNNSRESFLDIILRDAVAETAIAILKHKRYEECINMYSPDLSHPILRIIETIPKAFQALLDQCMLCSPLQPEHPDYWEEYNFKYLTLDSGAPSLSPQRDERPTEKRGSFLTSSCSTNEAEQPLTVQMKKESQYAVLNHLIKYRHRTYLVHPLVNTFLNLKWRRYALPFHVFRFMLFLLLTIVLSIFILVTPLTAQSVETTANTTANYSGEVSYGFNNSSIVFQFLTLVLCGVNFLVWLLDVYVKGLACVKYLLAESSVWMYGITLFFTFIFTIPWRGLDILYWEFGAMAVFFGWFTVAVLLQTFEVVGIFITMMFKVTRNVVGVLLITIVMIFAFAFPLYILVGTVPELTFTTIGMSLFSILASLNAEIDYNTFVRLELMRQFPYTVLTIIVVCVLTIIMPIVVTNLLIGLAVGDIASIQKEAILSQRSVEVRTLTAIDKLIPKLYFKKFLQQQTYKLYPNKNIWLKFKRIIHNLWSEVDELEDKNAVATTSQDSEQFKDNRTKIWKLESTLSKIVVEQSQQKETLQRMEEMLRTLISQKENEIK